MSQEARQWYVVYSKAHRDLCYFSVASIAELASRVECFLNIYSDSRDGYNMNDRLLPPSLSMIIYLMPLKKPMCAGAAQPISTERHEGRKPPDEALQEKRTLSPLEGI
jgi:hypothetical protein